MGVQRGKDLGLMEPGEKPQLHPLRLMTSVEVTRRGMRDTQDPRAESLDSVCVTCLFTERPICLELAFHDFTNAH